MTSIDPGLLALLVAFVLAGAMVNGLIGLGFSLIAVNIIAVALGTKEAIIVMSIVSPVTSGYQLWLNRSAAPLWIRLRPVIAGAFLGSLHSARSPSSSSWTGSARNGRRWRQGASGRWGPPWAS